MKRFGYTVLSVCLPTLDACISHEPMDQEEDVVKVSIGFTAVFLTNDVATRAEQPMVPDYESLIGNLWILQFDCEGILIGSEQIVLTIPVFNTTLEGVTLRTGRSTFCIVGNLTDVKAPAWPDNLNDSKSLVVDMSWMKKRSADRNICLFGYYEGEITIGTTVVNVALGCLVRRFSIAVSAKMAGVLSNAEIQLKRAQTKGYLFPSDTYLAPENGDHTEEVITAGTLGITSPYRYYYMVENVTTGTNQNERT